MLSERRDLHASLSRRLEAMNDNEISELLSTEDPKVGWGTSRVIEIDGHPVFAKSLPLTDLESADPTSTRNLFGLPAVYNYGVGSAGFGAAREVAAHVKTTGWVLDGQIENFPLTYHHRLLPLAGQTRRRDADQLDRYVAMWDNNEAVRDFTTARQDSTRCITVFVEHLPHVLMDWLPDHQEAVDSVIDQGLAITEFLRSADVAHLDANPSNILVSESGELFFADFGLFLDTDFDLSETERAFLADHQHFDIAQIIASLTWSPPGQTLTFTPEFLEAVKPFAAMTAAMNETFATLFAGPKSTSYYNDNAIAALLDEALRQRQ